MFRKLLLAGVASLGLLSPVAVTTASAHEGHCQEVRHEKAREGHRHAAHRERHRHGHAHKGFHHGRHGKG